MDKRLRLVLKNLIIFTVIFAAIIIGVMIGLNKYTHHSEVIIVPDVTSLSVEEAADYFEKKGLRYKVVDSIYIKSRLPGSIIEQKPAPGSKVKNNRFIFLTINSSDDEKIKLPDVRDFSQRQAEATLEAAGIKIADVEFMPSEFQDLVLDVRYNARSISKGYELPKGSYVTLVVGQAYSSSEILAPDLQLLTLTQSIDEAHKRSLNIGNIYYDETPKNAEDAKLYKVYRQDPIPGTPVTIGRKIELWMTKDSEVLAVPQESYAEEEEVYAE